MTDDTMTCGHEWRVAGEAQCCLRCDRCQMVDEDESVSSSFEVFHKPTANLIAFGTERFCRRFIDLEVEAGHDRAEFIIGEDRG